MFFCHLATNLNFTPLPVKLCILHFALIKNHRKTEVIVPILYPCRTFAKNK
ncbi:MAG: hypothetical protein GY870_15755 [archaeon]|nr:hypothetical protein [archaeon]